MTSNILITGAAGFIGGSVVANFLADDSAVMKKASITVAVRSSEQAKALSQLGVNVLQLDLTDEEAVRKEQTAERFLVNIVIHCSSSIDSKLALPLITALGKRREVNSEESYFIHTSGDSAFYESSGWPHGKLRDTDHVFDLERQSMNSFPIRKTDVDVIEHAKAQGVTSFIVVPTMVYGKGSGEWNKLSVLLPVVIRGSISHQTVSKFPQDTKISAVHISDLTAFYARIVEKILQKETIPSGKEGYYFAQACDVNWWEILDRLALALYSRGLVKDSKAQIWPSDEAAAKSLDIPTQFVKILWNSNANIIGQNKHRLGWKARWTKEQLLQNLDDEIDAVLELGEAKSSLIGSLHDAARV